MHTFYLLRISRRNITRCVCANQCARCCCLVCSPRYLSNLPWVGLFVCRTDFGRTMSVLHTFYTVSNADCPFSWTWCICKQDETVFYPALWTWTKSTVCQHRNVLHRVAFAQSLSFAILRQPKQLNSSVGCERHQSYAIHEENGWNRGEYHLLNACK